MNSDRYSLAEMCKEYNLSYEVSPDGKSIIFKKVEDAMSEKQVFEGTVVLNHHGMMLNKSGEDFDYDSEHSDSYEWLAQFSGHKVRITIEELEG